MLVLTRKKDEKIVIQIGDKTVVLQVVAIDRDRVRLGIDAPPDMVVHRQEVMDRIKAGDELTPA